MSEPDVEVGYSLSFPLPFRVFTLTSLGILAWATNLHGLDKFGVDAVTALDLRVGDHYSPRRADIAALYKNLYRIFVIYSVWCFFSWAVFRSLSKGDPSLVDVFGYIPAVFALVTLLVLLLPFNVSFKVERDKFLQYVLFREIWAVV